MDENEEHIHVKNKLHFVGVIFVFIVFAFSNCIRYDKAIYRKEALNERE